METRHYRGNHKQDCENPKQLKYFLQDFYMLKKTNLLGQLSEFKIRELNDYLNKLIKDKVNWEKRIMQLGGRDYRVFGFFWDFGRVLSPAFFWSRKSRII